VTLVRVEHLVRKDAFLGPESLLGGQQCRPPLRAQGIELGAFRLLVGHTVRVQWTGLSRIHEHPGRSLSSSPDGADAYEDNVP